MNPSVKNNNMSAFDIRRFFGTWYEVARLPNPWEPNPPFDAFNTTATYTDQGGGIIGVTNRQINQLLGDAFFRQSASATAHLSTKTTPGSIATLIISFFPGIYANYEIFEIDSDYQWAIVGSLPKTPLQNAYLWFLCKNPPQPSYDREWINELKKLAATHGFNTSSMIIIKHIKIEKQEIIENCTII